MHPTKPTIGERGIPSISFILLGDAQKQHSHRKIGKYALKPLYWGFCNI